MQILRFLLTPIALIYKLITGIRNYLYDIRHFKSFSFEIPMISVGNLTVGGTGKTPHVEFLIRMLKDVYHVGVLSRGYGRKTTGFIMADELESAKTIGDEPMQYFQKYGHEVSVSVCESRAYAVPCIAFEKPETQVILLDDAFQHRKVKPDFNILLSDYKRPFYDDYILPVGLLRESRKGASRADAIIVSKSPEDLSAEEQETITSQIQRYAPQKPVFFTSILYGAPQPITPIDHQIAVCENIVLFAGLANMKPLETYLKSKYTVLHSFDFKDHHRYHKDDIVQIIQIFNQFPEKNKCLFTTEKDMVKLLDPILYELISTYPVFYVPIEVAFLNREEEFKTLLMNKCSLAK